MSDQELSRRKFVKYAGVTGSAAALAGCGGDNGGDGSSGDGSDSGSGTTLSGDTLDNGERPIKWMGPAWSNRDGQVSKFTEMTDINLDASRATIPTVQQKILGGDRESVDAFSVETSGAGALVQANDAHIPVPTGDLENWDTDSVSDLFSRPEERLDFLGAQAQTITDILWQDDAKSELRFPPTVYNFDAVGYNPKFVDEATLWSDIFDEQYNGQSIIGETASITIPQVLMHLLDNEMIDGKVGDINNPTQEQLDAAIDFLIEQKNAGQFRSTWGAYGQSVNLMSGEEAVIGDLWQPAALDVRRSGTPCTYATMETGQNGLQGYRFWYGGISPTNPGARERNNYNEVTSLINDVHYGAWFPGYIQGWGYSVPHYPNEELVRTGSDDSGQGMGPEYYDWAYRGTKTYQSVEEPALFDPQEYDWSMEEGEPAEDGSVRDSGDIEERIDRLGFFQIWPDEAEYMQQRWQDFTSA